ncbi:RNA pseudouridine synthase [Labilibaculum sp. A4]|uniref:RluA family pseudouridine synthase n=1 Tax=Labilibaculum euxinus TaxID=2686357 RepID=UPI000F623C74|nr:RluA family pseudouridine synthase [Labilibaculum euxinus]MDQ1771163.1 RluA family pseudouridine synthase [Labilibaculum euxinus]MWN76830.1 RNA pseudouridine synthase [Labilibaculum euxinus]
MEENQKPQHKVKPRFQPRGCAVLYEDQDIIVVEKVSGLLTMGSDRERTKTAYQHVTHYVKKGNPRSKNRIFIVHRLDKDTSGVLVFAKTEAAKIFLQTEWQSFSKTYIAVVEGKLAEKEGIIESYLTENSIHRVFSVRNPNKGKYAKTGYKVIRESKYFSMLEINLFTGRKNQIRVHFSEHGNPVAGDKVYGIKGKGVKRLALHSASLTIQHPFTKKEMTFETNTPGFFKQLMK